MVEGLESGDCMTGYCCTTAIEISSDFREKPFALGVYPHVTIICSFAFLALKMSETPVFVDGDRIDIRYEDA